MTAVAVLVSIIFFQTWLALLLSWYFDDNHFHDKPLKMLYYFYLGTFVVMSMLFFGLYYLISKIYKEKYGARFK